MQQGFANRPDGGIKAGAVPAGSKNSNTFRHILYHVLIVKKSAYEYNTFKAKSKAPVSQSSIFLSPGEYFQFPDLFPPLSGLVVNLLKELISAELAGGIILDFIKCPGISAGFATRRSFQISLVPYFKSAAQSRFSLDFFKQQHTVDFQHIIFFCFIHLQIF
jgi:hypothetical protein